MMSDDATVKALRGLASGARVIAPLVGGAAGVSVGRYAAAALGLAADLLAAGADPVTTIERIRRTEPLLRDVEKAWEAELEAKLEQKQDPYEDI
jgi:hypothetical protein